LCCKPDKLTPLIHHRHLVPWHGKASLTGSIPSILMCQLCLRTPVSDLSGPNIKAGRRDFTRSLRLFFTIGQTAPRAGARLPPPIVATSLPVPRIFRLGRLLHLEQIGRILRPSARIEPLPNSGSPVEFPSSWLRRGRHAVAAERFQREVMDQE
jgi:hypothetical protein